MRLSSRFSMLTSKTRVLCGSSSIRSTNSSIPPSKRSAADVQLLRRARPDHALEKWPTCLECYDVNRALNACSLLHPQIFYERTQWLTDCGWPSETRATTRGAAHSRTTCCNVNKVACTLPDRTSLSDDRFPVWLTSICCRYKIKFDQIYISRCVHTEVKPISPFPFPGYDARIDTRCACAHQSPLFKHPVLIVLLHFVIWAVEPESVLPSVTPILDVKAYVWSVELHRWMGVQRIFFQERHDYGISPTGHDWLMSQSQLNPWLTVPRYLRMWVSSRCQKALRESMSTKTGSTRKCCWARW